MMEKITSKGGDYKPTGHEKIDKILRNYPLVGSLFENIKIKRISSIQYQIEFVLPNFSDKTPLEKIIDLIIPDDLFLDYLRGKYSFDSREKKFIVFRDLDDFKIFVKEYNKTLEKKKDGREKFAKNIKEINIRKKKCDFEKFETDLLITPKTFKQDTWIFGESRGEYLKAIDTKLQEINRPDSKLETRYKKALEINEYIKRTLDYVNTDQERIPGLFRLHRNILELIDKYEDHLSVIQPNEETNRIIDDVKKEIKRLDIEQAEQWIANIEETVYKEKYDKHKKEKMLAVTKTAEELIKWYKENPKAEKQGILLTLKFQKLVHDAKDLHATVFYWSNVFTGFLAFIPNIVNFVTTGSFWFRTYETLGDKSREMLPTARKEIMSKQPNIEKAKEWLKKIKSKEKDYKGEQRKKITTILQSADNIIWHIESERYNEAKRYTKVFEKAVDNAKELNIEELRWPNIFNDFLIYLPETIDILQKKTVDQFVDEAEKETYKPHGP